MPSGWSAAITKPCCVAVEDLDVHVVIAAASPWAKAQGGRCDTEHSEQRHGAEIHPVRFAPTVRRQLLLIMPLENVKFQAGVTAILEGMAMGKAVICSRVPGQTDVVIEGENGRYVPPGDPTALRTEICRLLSDPEEAARLGTNGRKLDRMRDESGSLCAAANQLFK